MFRKLFCVNILCFIFGLVEPVVGECCREAPGEPTCGRSIVWIPNTGPLFKPFVADPRQLTFSAGWRFCDDVFDKDGTAPVSFDNHFILFDLFNPFGRGGTLQLELDAGVWAIFEHTNKLMPLDNADYYVGIPVTYCTGYMKYRLRLWHMSSHLGDEFMEMHPEVKRQNPSAEYLDFFASYEPSWRLRIYGGIGYVLRSDKNFPCKHFYADYGFETRMPWWNMMYRKSQLWGRPFAGAHFRSKQDNNFNFDGTFVVGYEWAKMCTGRRSIRLFGEYHTGYSTEGQFCRLKTDYFALRISYGY